MPIPNHVQIMPKTSPNHCQNVHRDDTCRTKLRSTVRRGRTYDTVASCDAPCYCVFGHGGHNFSPVRTLLPSTCGAWTQISADFTAAFDELDEEPCVEADVTEAPAPVAPAAPAAVP